MRAGALTFFDALGVTLPEHGGANRSVRCFANPDAHSHGDRRPSCSVNIETGAWQCFACGAKGGPYDAALAVGVDPRAAMGLLRAHGLIDSTASGAAPSRARSPRRQDRARHVIPPAATSNTVFAATEEELERHRALMVESRDVVARLGELRGWTPQAMTRLGLGFDGQRIVFGVRDGVGRLVGLLRYEPDRDARDGRPKMLAIPGSRRELFPSPESLNGRLVWLVEGEPDAVAAWSLGLSAVGVPGCGGWKTAWAARFAGMHVAIVCDCDSAGRELARRIAANVLAVAASVRVLDLHAARHDGYDLSDMVLENAAIAAGDPACADWRAHTRRLLISAAATVAPLYAEVMP